MILAFSLTLVLLLPLPVFHLVSAAKPEEQLYTVMVRARCDIRGSDVEIPIYLDGADSGFSTPHEFTGLTGFHNFSVSNEHANGHFIKDPPSFQSDSADAGFRILSEGVNWIVIGPPNASDSEATIEFRYGSAPFVQNFRDTFEPGTMARLGVKVYMDPTRIAVGHLDVYNHDWPVDVAKTPAFTSPFTVHGIEPAFVQFEIPKNASTGPWGYKITIKDPTLNFHVNASFDVAFHPTPASASFPSFEVLPHSTFSFGGTQYAFFENPQASAVVLFVGGGMIGGISGPTPINGYSNASDQSSASYRLIYDLVANGFSVVTPSGPWQGLDFPSQLVYYLRNHSENKFYAIGHSAGGVVVANSIITHPGLFSKAIIADAPLTQESTGFYFTDLCIRSETVMIPHLLIWGRGDDQAKLGNAYAWMDHANQDLATLKVYDYDHDWAGTTVETQVRKQILGFLTKYPPIATSENVTGNLITSAPIVNAILSLESFSDLQVTRNFRDSVLETQIGPSLLGATGMLLFGSMIVFALLVSVILLRLRRVA